MQVDYLYLETPQKTNEQKGYCQNEKYAKMRKNVEENFGPHF